MRIYSSFRDYYDVVNTTYNKEDTTIFTRETSTSKLKYPFDYKSWRSGIMPAIKDRSSFERGSIEIANCFFLVAGRLYPQIVIHSKDSKSFHYSASSVKQELTRLKAYDSIFNDRTIYHGTKWKEVESLFSVYTGSEMLMDFAIEHKIVIGYDAEYDKFNHNRFLVINPRLHDYGFEKTLDPYTIYQELEMFLSNALVNVDSPQTNQSSEEKILSHGFDLKTSFRGRQE